MHILNILTAEGLLKKPDSFKELAGYLNQAVDISLNSRYFIFDSYDSWAHRTEEGLFEGYSIYQLVKEKMIMKRGIGLDNSLVSLEDAMNYLKISKEYLPYIFLLKDSTV